MCDICLANVVLRTLTSEMYLLYEYLELYTKHLY